MSIYDYQQSQIIAGEGYPFYALIMAAMRQADDDNMVKLKAMFPDTYEELHGRYHSPSGKLPTDTE